MTRTTQMKRWFRVNLKRFGVMLDNKKAAPNLETVSLDEQTQKKIEFLEKYKDKKVIRIQPNGGDYSYINNPIVFKDTTQDGRIICEENGEICKLPISFTDFNWMEYNEAIRADKNHPLYKWIGKEIRRVKEVELDSCEDQSFIMGNVKLISVNQHHIVVECESLGKIICDNRYSIAADWKLVN